MVIDLGAETSTVLKINDRGRVTDWAGQDKCAAGTGMFLQAMAKVMQVNLDEMAEYSLRAKNRADISARTCAVFAESEVISHIHRVPPTPKEEIIAGIHASMVSRIMGLLKRLGIEKGVAVVGGVARNKGLIDILEESGIQSPGAGKPRDGGRSGRRHTGQRKLEKCGESKMITAGIDIGSRASKGRGAKDGKMLSSYIGDTGAESVVTSKATMAKTLEGTGWKIEDMNYIVATGYGRVLVPFANENISEISCHARGINYYFPSVRTILDMGGQDCKAISVDGEGRVTNFVMNDKCAGGTGRFLEMIADVLGVPLTEIGDTALASKSAIPFNTICAVFARSEAVAYLRKGVNKSDILSGLNEAISVRCLNLLKKVAIERLQHQRRHRQEQGNGRQNHREGGAAAAAGGRPAVSRLPGSGPLCGRPRHGQGQARRDEDQLRLLRRHGRILHHHRYRQMRWLRQVCSGLPGPGIGGRQERSGQPKARVKESLRKKLHLSCPGFKNCSEKNALNCHSACAGDAISHSW